jgi:hypothetical protein
MGRDLEGSGNGLIDVLRLEVLRKNIQILCYECYSCGSRYLKSIENGGQHLS